MKKNIIFVLGFLCLLIVGFVTYAWYVEPNLGDQALNTSGNQDLFYNQQQAEATSTEQTKNQQTQMKHLITLKTTLGDIQFETYDSDAPKATNNFVSLAQKGFYDSVIFHRVIKGFMIQGGDPTGTGRGGPGYTFEDELDPNTASAKQGYVKGVVAMANAGPNTNGSQFFIMLKDTPLPHSYTIFGKVVKGQEVVDAIGNLPTDESDKPLTPPKITGVVVEEVK